MPVTVTIGGGWGAGGWGAMPWGGGSPVTGALDLADAVAVRENAVRLEFTVPVYYSAILDPFDASDIRRHYGIAVVEGTVGLDGEPVRPVNVIAANLVTVDDGIDQGDVGRFVDLIFDRPMTPYPARYLVSVRDIYDIPISMVIPAAEREFNATFKRIEPPQLEVVNLSRDIANPQTLEAARDPIPDSDNPSLLGTYRYDDQNDVAFDEGLVSLKKRVIRRLITVKNAFAHLPGYGVGVPSYGKLLATAATLTTLVGDAESQIAREPDVAKVKVRAVLDRQNPGLVRFRVVIKPKTGKPQAFDVPFSMV